MGQKVNPFGLRVGVIKDWGSKWYADADQFGDLLVEDQKIRNYIKEKLYKAGIAKIELERGSGRVKITIYAAKPGMVIGVKPSSRDLEKLKANVDANASRQPPKWLEYDAANMLAKVTAAPAKEDIDLPIEEHLIVELYSK